MFARFEKSYGFHRRSNIPFWYYLTSIWNKQRPLFFLFKIIHVNIHFPKIQAEETQLADTLQFLLNYGSSAQVDDVLMHEAGLSFFFVN